MLRGIFYFVLIGLNLRSGREKGKIFLKLEVLLAKEEIE